MRLESIVLTAVLLVLACASFFLIVNVFELSHTSIALIIFILGLICAKFVFPMMIKAKVNQKNKESNKEAHTTKRAKEKAIKIEAQDRSDESIEITFPEEQEQESLVKDTLNLKQVVSDPNSIYHTIIHNKRTLLDFLFMQSKKSGRIPNIALFFGLDCKIKKKDIKAVLDAFNISFYDENINENFKRSFAFITQAKADYGLIVLEKESGELIDVILANETINDIYDLSLEIWNLFENANPYPQAKNLSGKSCLLLYDNFITRYSGDIYFHMGSISSLDIRERLKDKREQNIFGYIERGVSSGIDSSEYEYNKEQAQKALRALSEYFDDDMLAFVNMTSFNAPFSALVKDNGKKLQVLFFSDEYDSNGVDVDNNFFTDPYLALLDTLGEEEEIYAESLYGVNLLEPKEQYEELFIGGEATNYDWQLLSYERVQNQQNYKEAYNATIEQLKKSLQSGEQTLFYEDILKYEDSLKNRVDSQILHKRGKAKRQMGNKEVDSTDREGAYDMLFKAIMLSDFDLFEEAIANGADANGVVSAKQAESELAREQYLCEEGASHYAMAVGKILDCIALDDEDLSEESLKEECEESFKIVYAMRDLNPCNEALEFTKEMLQDTHDDWWYEAYKEADEFGYEGDLDDEEALHTWLRNHKPLTYFEVLGKELGLELELSWE
ncbi:hypothetical protein [Helicobacter typhlonius]|uniref:Predicted membrane-associated n=7 Tax=Helicobacter typhlonius TaxID=76936 RepID=A0A099UG25_9HELI|nr:hypothetical protein [Helicobacter typhlonius]TLD79410.1 hypothetical protein LS75_000230 [Helicobacter typhlonius]CUU39501.1 predicted membrane-associated [Helicobacter typhlonius]